MPASKARVEASKRYNIKTYDNMNFRLRKDGGDGITKNMVSAAASECGESLTQFIVTAIRERLERLEEI